MLFAKIIYDIYKNNWERVIGTRDTTEYLIKKKKVNTVTMNDSI